jgi:VanZ family protein
MIPLRHRPLWVAMSAVLVASVAYFSLASVSSPPLPANFDKLEHFTVYCGLAVWFTGLYPRSRYWKVVAGLVALGLGLEVAQGAMQLGRTADAFDMVANAAGVGVGLVLALMVTGNWARRVESWLGPS